MISMILATCLVAPFYMDIGECDLSVGPCQCTEIAWDASDGATSYEINRTDPDGTKQTVGTLTQQTGINEDGSTYIIPPNTAWSVALDSQFPEHLVSYRYAVRACNSAGCSTWTDAVPNLTWPYACYDHELGHELACYPGDPLLH